MSEFSNVIIVKDISMINLQNEIKSKNINAFLLQLNSQWIAINIEYDIAPDIGKINLLAQKMSFDLNAYTFSFVHSSDDGWSYYLYLSGNVISNFCEEYTIDNKMLVTALDLKSLLVVGGRNEFLQLLMKHANNDSRDNFDFSYSVALFKKAFDFEKISYFSYEHLSNSSNVYIDELIFVSKHQKKAYFDVLGCKEIVSLMLSNDYVYDELESNKWGSYCFSKKYNKNKIIIYIYVNNKEFIVNIITPFGTEPIREFYKFGIFKPLIYRNKKQAKDILLHSLAEFIKNEEFIDVLIKLKTNKNV